MRISKNTLTPLVALLTAAIFLFQSCSESDENKLKVSSNSHIVLVGNNLGSRMMNFGHFETEVQLRHPKDSLFIRNMCDGATPQVSGPTLHENLPGLFRERKNLSTTLAVWHNSVITIKGMKGEVSDTFLRPTNGLPALRQILLLVFSAMLNLLKAKKDLIITGKNSEPLSNIPLAKSTMVKAHLSCFGFTDRL